MSYDEYVKRVYQSGKEREAAEFRATVDRLMQSGSDSLVKLQRAREMNDVWQLRAGMRRVLYFWHGTGRAYVILNGFGRQSRKTPPAELQREKAKWVEHLAGEGNDSTG